MEELSLWDRDFLVAVLGQCWEDLTPRQRETLLLLLCGLTEQEAARLLGITQPVVSQHFAAALSKIRATADRMENYSERGMLAEEGVGHLRGLRLEMNANGDWQEMREAGPPPAGLIADIYGRPMG